jgi:hypothetical protein
MLVSISRPTSTLISLLQGADPGNLTEEPMGSNGHTPSVYEHSTWIPAPYGWYRKGKVQHIGLSEDGSETLRRAVSISPRTAVPLEYSPFEPASEYVPGPNAS